jgi:replicative DNA helicase
MKHKRKKETKPLYDYDKLRKEAFYDTCDLAPDVLTGIEKIFSEEKPPPGLDLLPGCLAPRTVTVVASMPSQGKTSFLMGLALEAQEKKKNVAVFLTDSTRQEFVLKAICSRAGVNLSGAKMGRLPREAWPALTRSAGQLIEPGIFISRSNIISSSDIYRQAKVLKESLKEDGQSLDAVIVDSLNHIKHDEYEAGYLHLFELTEVARDLETAVICSFGMRETPGIHNGYAGIGDTREAGLDDGYLSQLYFLRRPEYYDRQDPTLKDMAELRRLHPYLGGARCPNLRFNHESATFSLAETLIPIQTENLF